VLYHSFCLFKDFCLFRYMRELVGGAKLRRDGGLIGWTWMDQDGGVVGDGMGLVAMCNKYSEIWSHRRVEYY
jgi:hypothetical protein